MSAAAAKSISSSKSDSDHLETTPKRRQLGVDLPSSSPSFTSHVYVTITISSMTTIECRATSSLFYLFIVFVASLFRGL